ncbi:hypothetical protein EMPG_13726 [Blastomyces silverae]|uniref:Uncharacterized protein n=1 Tax=Blastomyces silverae TaxID=2060906 RepID=A0A0H1BP84_9EURO|nr:hypothetical protein EMPG_13726 [Blastomyces silverae]
MHYSLPVGVPELRMATVGDSVPGPDQPRSREPLHAYVCNVDNGWFGPEPQESRFEQELDPVPVL